MPPPEGIVKSNARPQGPPQADGPAHRGEFSRGMTWIHAIRPVLAQRASRAPCSMAGPRGGRPGSYALSLFSEAASPPAAPSGPAR